MQYQNGEEFLNYLNKNMHLEDIVMHTAEKSDTPVKKINKYMLRLERIHNMTKNNKHKMNILKQLYYDKYIIDELPESYIALIICLVCSSPVHMENPVRLYVFNLLPYILLKNLTWASM